MGDGFRRKYGLEKAMEVQQEEKKAKAPTYDPHVSLQKATKYVKQHTTDIESLQKEMQAQEKKLAETKKSLETAQFKLKQAEVLRAEALKQLNEASGLPNAAAGEDSKHKEAMRDPAGLAKEDCEEVIAAAVKGMKDSGKWKAACDKYAATVSAAGGVPSTQNEWLIRKMSLLYTQGDLPKPNPDPPKPAHTGKHQTEAEEEAERRKRARCEGDAAGTQGEQQEGMQD